MLIDPVAVLLSTIAAVLLAVSTLAAVLLAVLSTIAAVPEHPCSRG